MAEKAERIESLCSVVGHMNITDTFQLEETQIDVILLESLISCNLKNLTSVKIPENNEKVYRTLLTKHILDLVDPDLSLDPYGHSHRPEFKFSNGFWVGIVHLQLHLNFNLDRIKITI